MTRPAGRQAGSGCVLAYHVGSLGDTILTVPSLRAVRAAWPDHRVVLLSNGAAAGTAVTARHLLEGDALVDEFVEYDRTLAARRLPAALFTMAHALRRRQFDAAVYLAPTDRPAAAVSRDRWFFRACAIRRLLGFHARPDVGQILRGPDGRALPTASEARRKLDRLEADGLRAPSHVDVFTVPLLTLTAAEHQAADRLRTGARPGRPLVAMGAFPHWLSKQWPIERFEELGRRIAAMGFDIVLVGSDLDRPTAEQLRAGWGFGVNACGPPPRVIAGLLATCRAFVGVDSGPAHLAAAMGIPSVVISWAGGLPGQWAPLGAGHVVLRRSVPCEVCRLTVCPVDGHPCMRGVTVDEAWQALEPLLSPGPTDR